MDDGANSANDNDAHSMYSTGVATAADNDDEEGGDEGGGAAMDWEVVLGVDDVTIEDLAADAKVSER